MTASEDRDADLGQLGRYTLVRRLGAGGMGEVFLARATGAAGFETKVCIKRLVPHLAHEADFIERFIGEGKLLSNLRHPGIAQILDLGEVDGAFFLAMEYVDGFDLRTMMMRARSGELVPEPAILAWIICRVLEALDYAHRQGIVHRDVSPSNVMIGRSGDVKLVDFGLALASVAARTATPGRVLGKIGYTSPEQAAGETVDARSDLFSTGVMAWELFTGRRPFHGATDVETLERLRVETPARLDTLVDGLAPGLCSAVQQMLEKEPERRFQDADQARRAIATVIKDEAIGTREVADWLGRVESWAGAPTNPSGLSLEGALGLGLGEGLEARADHTVSIAPSGPPMSPSEFPGPVPPSSPKDPSSEAAKGKSGGLLALLVLLNIALLSTVAILVFQWSEATRTTTATPAPPQVRNTRQADPMPADSAASTTARSDATPPIDLSRPPIGHRVGRYLTQIRPPPGPAATSAVAATGKEEDKRASNAKARVAVTLKPKPATASVRVKGYGRKWVGARTLQVPQGTRLSIEASAAGYDVRRLELKVDEAQTRVITLTRSRSGHVTFRYFPANAFIHIDGKPIATRDTNLVRVKLDEGSHEVVIKSSGKRRAIKFKIEADKTTNLKTVRLN